MGQLGLEAEGLQVLRQWAAEEVSPTQRLQASQGVEALQASWSLAGVVWRGTQMLLRVVPAAGTHCSLGAQRGLPIAHWLRSQSV